MNLSVKNQSRTDPDQYVLNHPFRKKGTLTIPASKTTNTRFDADRNTFN